MLEEIEQKEWFVLQAMYGKALKAEQLLKSLSINSFVPMELKVEVVKGRKKPVAILRPILSNLIFVETTFTRLKEVCTAYSYLYYRTIHSKSKEPMIVPREQMQNFIDFIKAGGSDSYNELEYINPESFDIEKGELVRIISGAFEGQVGKFVKIEKKTA